MFDPTTTITASGWMLQSVTKSTSKQRAQALTAKGNEHASTLWGERSTETAEFTLGGAYTGNVTIPALGSGITDWTLTYSETEYPKLSVSKDSAAGGGTFACPIDFPARALGVPSSITGLCTTISGVKQLVVSCTCQHVEETNGSGEYNAATLSGMRDVTLTATFTGISGKPTLTPATGWVEESTEEGNSNTAIGSGSVTWTKHCSIGTDTDAADYSAST